MRRGPVPRRLRPASLAPVVPRRSAQTRRSGAGTSRSRNTGRATSHRARCRRRIRIGRTRPASLPAEGVGGAESSRSCHFKDDACRPARFICRIARRCRGRAIRWRLLVNDSQRVAARFGNSARNGSVLATESPDSLEPVIGALKPAWRQRSVCLLLDCGWGASSGGVEVVWLSRISSNASAGSFRP